MTQVTAEQDELPGDLLPASGKSAGHVIVDTLASHGIKRAHVVPGESFLDVLDGLHDSSIETIVCRHEGGATYMAEADGKMNQLPGIAMVTRGPGAANAHVGLHTAWQDSTPMVLFVGLIPFAHRDREAFQEFDIKAWFARMPWSRGNSPLSLVRHRRQTRDGPRSRRTCLRNRR